MGEGVSQDWCPSKPNNGFLIRHEGRIVGGIGAIYAERLVRGRTERFCNITSWCVLDAFRAQSMRLAMALTGQPGFHFTDLTPTEVVSKTLQFLKFKPMNERQAIWPNLPWPFAATRRDTRGDRPRSRSQRVLAPGRRQGLSRPLSSAVAEAPGRGPAGRVVLRRVEAHAIEGYHGGDDHRC